MRLSKEALSIRVVVRRAKRGAAPFVWEINRDNMAEPVFVSPEAFRSMESAYQKPVITRTGRELCEATDVWHEYALPGGKPSDTVFMVAAGYPPTSTHLGRGESWAPLYQPYNPGGSAERNELGVIRDLNNAWYGKCTEFVTLGLQILDDNHIAEDHKTSRDAVLAYLVANRGNATVAGALILDALTVHDGETDRINRTLK